MTKQIIRQREGSGFYAEYDGAYLNFPKIAALLQSPDESLFEANILLSNAWGCVGLIEADGRKVVIKEHKMRSFFKGIKYMVMPSRGYRSWKCAQLLERCAIPVPKPIGYVDKRLSFFKKHSYFFYEYVEGIDLSLLLKKEGGADQGVIESCVELIGRLKKERISFRDLKGSNIVISKEGACLIDIHAIKQNSFRFNFLQRRNVARFLYSIRNYPETKEAFIACFNRHGMRIDQGMLKMVFAPY